MLTCKPQMLLRISLQLICIKIIKQQYKILNDDSSLIMLRLLDTSGWNCYFGPYAKEFVSWQNSVFVEGPMGLNNSSFETNKGKQ